MTRAGRIHGRKSANGAAYELVQFDVVRQSIPIEQAHADERLKAAIEKNKWEPL